MGFFSSIAKAVAGPLISGAFGLGGAAISGGVNRKLQDDQQAFLAEQNRINIREARRVNAQSMKFARKESRLDRRLQKDFAQLGVRWRVDDAKAAGLHPLAALGVQPASFSPSAVMPALESYEGQASTAQPSTDYGPAMANMGQNIGAALLALLDPTTRAMREAELAGKVAAARADNAQASAFEAEAAATRQRLNAATPIPLPESAWGYDRGADLLSRAEPLAPFYDTTRGVADEVVSQRESAPYISAGEHPGWKEFRVGKDTRILMPDAGTLSESIEALGEAAWMIPVVIEANQQYYGADSIMTLQKLLKSIK